MAQRQQLIFLRKIDCFKEDGVLVYLKLQYMEAGMLRRRWLRE